MYDAEFFIICKIVYFYNYDNITEDGQSIVSYDPSADNTKEYIYFEIDNRIYQLIINPKDFKNKSTIFIKLNDIISPINDVPSFNIFQTFKTNEIEILKFYFSAHRLNLFFFLF